MCSGANRSKHNMSVSLSQSHPQTPHSSPPSECCPAHDLPKSMKPITAINQCMVSLGLAQGLLAPTHGKDSHPQSIHLSFRCCCSSGKGEALVWFLQVIFAVGIAKGNGLFPSQHTQGHNILMLSPCLACNWGTPLLFLLPT